MAARAPSERRVFRHVPALLPMVSAVELGILGILAKWLARDPGVFTFKGVTLMSFFVVMGSFLGVMLWMLWVTASKFIISDTHLIVVNRIWWTRLAIPWGSIRSVSMIERSWWNRIGELALNEIRTRDGLRVLFGTHLLWYGGFLNVLKSEARCCEQFDPHPRGIGEG